LKAVTEAEIKLKEELKAALEIASILYDALERTRGQWMHSVNQRNSLEALKKARELGINEIKSLITQK
jgi:hypothetical protein